MIVALSGGTGFVGTQVRSALIERGHQVRMLARNPEHVSPQENLEVVAGDVLKPESLHPLLQGADAVIHLVGIIREFPPKATYAKLHEQATANMLQAAREQNVARFVHMSALGSSPESPSGYHRSKWSAEQMVAESGLDWTVFKPSVIFGPGDEFINLLRTLVALPIIPMIGNGSYPLQPVSVENIAQGFTRCLETPESIGKKYEIGGPRTYPYRELLREVGQLEGRMPRPMIPQPLALLRPLARTLGRFSFFPLTIDQLQMLEAGSSTAQNDFFSDLGIAPIELREVWSRYYAGT